MTTDPVDDRVIDQDTGEFWFIPDAPPLRPRMTRQEFKSAYRGIRYIEHPSQTLNGIVTNLSMFEYCILAGIQFDVWIVFWDHVLHHVQLFHSRNPPPPTGWFGQLKRHWKQALGTHVVPMTEEEEQQWIRERKQVHDDWLNEFLPNRGSLSWGRAESRQQGGPMWPDIIIEYY